MKRFKSFLLEYLTDKQRERYQHIEMTPKARADSDHFFGQGNDEVHGSLHSMTDKSEIHRKIENHLGQEISHEDYRAGLARDHLGRQTRIGRLIKDDSLRNEFAKDPTREGSRSGQSQYTTRTVRGVEVAGQTNSVPDAQHPKGHSWGNISCKNNETGINKHYLEDEIKHGTVTHFVKDHNGQEIYRATLQPHHNDEGHVAYAIDSEYGIKHPSFTEDAKRVAAKLSNADHTNGLFRKHGKVYHDSEDSYMLHPNVSSEQLHKYIAAPSDEYDDRKLLVKRLAIMHPNSDSTHIQRVLDQKDTHPVLLNRIASHPKITDEQISRLLDNPRNGVRRTVASNPNIKDHHIRKALADTDNTVRANIMSNPSTPTHHIINGTKDRSSLVRATAYANSKLPKEHLIKGLDDESDQVKATVVGNRSISGQHLTDALRNPSEHVRAAVFDNPNATPAHIELAKKDPHWQVQMRAASHKNATSDQLHDFIDHGFRETHVSVAKNPNANISHLNKLYDVGNTDTKFDVLAHPNVDSNLIHKVVSNDAETDDIKYHALKHPNATVENLKWASRNSASPFLRDAARKILGART
jgi:hypothetical protein